ncbi:MAG: 4-hydroxy-3-methylbut-2-en-1-yl diphosphate synthase [Lentisphaerae bacterium RIFOXYB12_FULL_65_16]|nr:MAG: 4-hydroxy-3-methylbut-2-en-1-yl diphosphate synthase [Lentisphaerae bacterium RIFOXYA12_64_32]OGV93947.1 MAG: 4-hydroxy-3-methylbut-2-en-1-yl diphosphate synthase [Lentisphaerae bacterium RIFOXYB12_FULL_65_16]
MIVRRPTRSIVLGTVAIGGTAPVSVQSMTTTDTRDARATLRQITALARAGCEIARVAVPDTDAATSLRNIVRNSPLPVVADIHFDARLALRAIEAGAHGIRINPGNLGGPDNVRQVARAAAAHRTVVRVGINAGSLGTKGRRPGPERLPRAMVDAALACCELLEQEGCHSLKVSLKASDVQTTVAAYRLLASRADYPLHLGVTEAGTREVGTLKSAVAFGCLLLEGIGDTLRVSLTAPPVEEVKAGIRILEAAGLRHPQPDIISCPTCGRTRINLFGLVRAVEREVARLKRQGFHIDLDKIAIMGCEVNGPGEAREADVGVAGGRGRGVLFKHGKVVKTLDEGDLLPALLEEVRRHATPTAAHPDRRT